eukprot:CAMPEP_0171080266 /NCGR_PEP_ID=MMETSP0766_2-20121228/15761_1 /TAXON_ID=439317 /ORGANISM="Gambierdiscus australes, Strain CAWD 149" /LENGTH=288 /DNA_ID=CAMNT_0011537489 /DNA_START=3 /DNA_END=869 /DNA_ORIENTATION=+
MGGGVKDMIKAFERRRPEPQAAPSRQAAPPPLRSAPTPLRNAGGAARTRAMPPGPDATEECARASVSVTAPASACTATVTAASGGIACVAASTAAVSATSTGAASAASTGVAGTVSLVVASTATTDAASRPGLSSLTAPSPTAWRSVIREEVDRCMGGVVDRLNKEQEEALQKVKELQQRSVELERAVERQQARPQRMFSASGLPQQAEDRARNLLMTPPAAPTSLVVGTAEQKALRRHSVSCMSLNSSISDLKVQRRWMMEQRMHLIEELYPHGGPLARPGALRGGA